MRAVGGGRYDPGVGHGDLVAAHGGAVKMNAKVLEESLDCHLVVMVDDEAMADTRGSCPVDALDPPEVFQRLCQAERAVGVGLELAPHAVAFPSAGTVI